MWWLATVTSGLTLSLVVFAASSERAASAAKGGVGEVQNVMAENMAMMEARGEKLRRLDDRTARLQQVLRTLSLCHNNNNNNFNF